MNLKSISLFLLLPALMLLLAACGGVPEPTLVPPTATPDIEATVQAKLFEARIEATVQARLEEEREPPTPTATSVPPTPTPTPTNTPTPAPTSTPSRTRTPTATPSTSLAAVIQQTRPSVVRIDVNLAKELGHGSGVIFEVGSANGSALILTNYHVIEGATRVTVTVNDTSTYIGTVKGVDQARDLAVIRICCGEFQKLPFADASNIQAGDGVITIGYALGIQGSATVTTGIVSAIRYEPESDRWVLQTDASVNPGGSGGPMLSTTGEILGITTYRIKTSSTGVAVEGFGFAVSETTIRTVLPGLAAEYQYVSLGTPIVFSTPTPLPSIYTSEKYWYSIDVPTGWKADFSNDEKILMWDPRSGTSIWVTVNEIDPDAYPTLDSYIAAWELGVSEGWTDFQILSERLIRTGTPVEAYEFTYTYSSSGSSTVLRSILHWYVLGKYQVGVEATAAQAVFNLTQHAEILASLKGAQDSFQPARYTSETYGYSVAHPPGWASATGAEPPSWASKYEGFDYAASSTLSTSYQATHLRVQVKSDAGTNIGTYGDRSTVENAHIISRQIVFAGRPNPSYRIHAVAQSISTGKPVRIVVQITLIEGNAIWVRIFNWTETWAELQDLVDDILLRIAVRS